MFLKILMFAMFIILGRHGVLWGETSKNAKNESVKLNTLKGFQASIIKAVFDESGEFNYVILSDQDFPYEKSYQRVRREVTINQVESFYASYYPITSYGNFRPKRIIFLEGKKIKKTLQLPDSILIKIWGSQKGNYLGIEKIQMSSGLADTSTVKGIFDLYDKKGVLLWQQNWSQILREDLNEGVPEDFISISDNGITAVETGEKLYIFDRRGNVHVFSFNCWLKSIIKWSSFGTILGVPACDKKFYLFDEDGKIINILKRKPSTFWISPKEDYIFFVEQTWKGGVEATHDKALKSSKEGRTLKVKVMLVNKEGKSLWEREEDWTKYHSFGNQFIHDVIFDPSEKFIVTTSKKCRYFYLFDLRSGNILRKIQKPNSFINREITYAKFISNHGERVLVMASGGNLLHYNLSTNRIKENIIPCDYVLYESPRGVLKGIASKKSIFSYHLEE